MGKKENKKDGKGENGTGAERRVGNERNME